MICPLCDVAHDPVAGCPLADPALYDDEPTDLMDRASLDELGSLVGVVLDGKYEVLELLGFGAVGRVYRARQESLRRHVAIKVLRQSFADAPRVQERFLQEARAVGRVEHDNVVQIYDAGLTETELPYLVMELVEGEPLTARIAREGRLRLYEVLHLGAQVLAGLEQAHRAGVVHRDVKPDNVLVASDDVAKIVDFGVARLEATDAQLTQRGEVLGTPAYLSPEQAVGTRVDAKADAWAASVLLYEMATGRRPFEGKQFMEILTSVMTAEPLPPSAHAPDLPAAFDRLVLSGLEKDPDLRADVSALAIQVHQLLGRVARLEMRDTRLATARRGSLAETVAEASEPEPE
ncbi:MAG: serine/threonine protein kinase [Sandaracinaceae bacterium]|nr:serine/threonine protein kinase [Sandaracinaceae bacterium]